MHIKTLERSNEILVKDEMVIALFKPSLDVFETIDTE